MKAVRSTNSAQEAAVRQLIGVVEQGTGADGHTPAGMTYRMCEHLQQHAGAEFRLSRSAMTYITGSHAFKVGFNRTHGFLQQTDRTTIQPFQYRFNSTACRTRSPCMRRPYTTISNEDNDLGLYVQDRWTMSRMTLSGALRFDYFGTSFPAQTIGPGLLLPNRNLELPGAGQPGLEGHHLSERVCLRRDRERQDGAQGELQQVPARADTQRPGHGSRARRCPGDVRRTRTWNDRGGLGINNDYIPQCDFLNPAANGECGATKPNTFGTAQGVLDTFDPDLLARLGPSADELRVHGGRAARDSAARLDRRRLFPADLGQFPGDGQHPRDRGGLYASSASSSRPIHGCRTAGRRSPASTTSSPTKFAQVKNYNTLSDKFGKQIEHWNGLEVALNARLHNGLTLQGAVGSAKQIEDNCEIVAQLPEMLNVAAAGGSRLPGGRRNTVTASRRSSRSSRGTASTRSRASACRWRRRSAARPARPTTRTSWRRTRIWRPTRRWVDSCRLAPTET